MSGENMIFRQLFERESSTYTYLIGCPHTRQACLIDTVKSQVPQYLQLLKELNLTLTSVIDTHTHADHITGAGALRELTQCTTFLGAEAGVECVSTRILPNQTIAIGDLSLKAIYTPGHTDDSYSFYLETSGEHYVFTGDTLLIRGTGRTDFQNGSPHAQYKSLFEQLLTLPPQTWVYPAHDYKGWLRSTIAEEAAHNPRLQVSDIESYVEIMNNLVLPHPSLMDVAIPANRACGNENRQFQ